MMRQRRSPLRWIKTVALLAALICPAVEQSARAEAPVDKKLDGAAIARGSGRYRNEGAKDWSTTSTGSVIRAGAVVEASNAEPLELTIPDGVEITLEPGASAAWHPASKLPTEHNGWARGYHLELRGGEIQVRVPAEPRGKRAFLVSTAAGTLTGWRGSVHVAVSGETTAASIYEGALVVGSNGIGFPVYDGAGILMRKGQNPDKSRGIPPVPTFTNDVPPGAAPPFGIVQGAARANMGFGWAPAPTAASYRIEIATDAAMMRVVHRGRSDSPRYAFQEPADGGRFFARVRAVGPEGIVGEWSAPKPMRMVHATLPEGAFVARDGAVVLPPGRALSLGDARGLEVAYETLRPGPRVASALHFFPAPSDLHADAAGTRLVHIRDASIGMSAPLLLASRELRAQVEVTPRRAHWPKDPLDVKVNLFDPTGRLDVSGETVAIEATVNLGGVNLPWKRVGNTFVARIEPRHTPGPWVVRVLVKDQRGAEIGFGFLEIDSETKTAGLDPR